MRTYSDTVIFEETSMKTKLGPGGVDVKQGRDNCDYSILSWMW
jgi:hypothetical protein